MTYFDDKRNRALLGGYLFCLALVEILFFAYGMEELHSPLYPVMIDLLLAALVQPLAAFADPERPAGLLFIGLGILIPSFFATLYLEWSYAGYEGGFRSLGTGAFWLHLLKILAACCLYVYGGMLLKGKIRPELLSFLVFLPAGLLWTGDPVYGLFLGICAAVAAAAEEKLQGGGIRMGTGWSLLLYGLFFASCYGLGVYREGRLLTEEAGCAFVLLLILAGLIVASRGNRFGLYAVSFLSLHYCFVYLGSFLRGAVDPFYLGGLVPFGLMAAAGLVTLSVRPAVEQERPMTAFRAMNSDKYTE